MTETIYLSETSSPWRFSCSACSSLWQR